MTTTAGPDSAEQLLAAAGGDRYVAAELDPRRLLRGFVADGAVGWLSRRPDGRPMWLSVVGPPEPAAALTATAVRESARRWGGPPAGLTVPRGTLAWLPPEATPAATEDWDWFWTDRRPPPQPAESDVAWLDGVDETVLRELLAEASPRHSAAPGSRHVRRWCGLHGPEGGLAAIAAHTEHVPGVPHLASIATRPTLRGRGYGAAVTAWLTRTLLADYPVVTLGMYADNTPARRLYLRLRYHCDHRFTSGRLPPSTSR